MKVQRTNLKKNPFPVARALDAAADAPAAMPLADIGRRVRAIVSFRQCALRKSEK
jgi:hypothetical protein